MTSYFKTIAIIGVGLIGGSLALATRRYKLAGRIIGIDADAANLQKAEALGVVDAGIADLRLGIKEADLVVIATPVRSIVPLVEQVAVHAREGTIITDVGSVKKEIVHSVDAMGLSRVLFVGGHPIAGTENSGVEAAQAALFLNRKSILTPTAQTDPRALDKVRNLWESVGAQVVCLDSDIHDYIFGAVSHLPHYIAFSLVWFLSDSKEYGESLFRFSGGGLKDFTRVAASDPTMWTDIALMNGDTIVELIEGYQHSLDTIKELIKKRDAVGLSAALGKARAVRRNAMME